MDRRAFLRLSAGAAATAATRVVETGTPATAATARVGRPWIPPQGRMYLGAFEWQPGFVRGISAPEGLEEKLGVPGDPRRLTINHCFRLTDETPGAWPQAGTVWGPLRERFLADRAAGRIPMLSWAAGSEQDSAAARVRRLREIAAGRRDGLIDGQAAALRDLRTPVFLRWTWEFDQRYHGHATDWKRAWMHVRHRFQQKGATNVAFVWCPTRNAFNLNGGAEALRFWPGAAHVDWVGCDGYSRVDDPRSFAELFGRAHTFSVAKRRPFMVAETGVERTDGRSQGAWVNGVTRLLDAGRFPNMKALVLYHRDVTSGADAVGWRLDQPPGSTLASLRTLAAHRRLITR